MGQMLSTRATYRHACGGACGAGDPIYSPRRERWLVVWRRVVRLDDEEWSGVDTSVCRSRMQHNLSWDPMQEVT